MKKIAHTAFDTMRALFLNSIVVFFIIFNVNGAVAKFPCMNDGVPIFTAHDSEFKCECKAKFYGPFCEYDTKSKQEESVSRQIIKVALCLFFLLLLPTLVIYIVRTVYLFLKRCKHGRVSNSDVGDCADDSPYQAVIEAAANIVFQQQQQQQQQLGRSSFSQQPIEYGGQQLSLENQSTNAATNSTVAMSSTVQTPTITLVPFFNFPYGCCTGYEALISSISSSPRRRHALRRTRTAAADGDISSRHRHLHHRHHHREMHTSRSLAFSGASTLTMNEFNQLLRDLQNLQDIRQCDDGAPPAYESAIRNQTSFI